MHIKNYSCYKHIKVIFFLLIKKLAPLESISIVISKTQILQKYHFLQCVHITTSCRIINVISKLKQHLLPNCCGLKLHYYIQNQTEHNWGFKFIFSLDADTVLIRTWQYHYRVWKATFVLFFYTWICTVALTQKCQEIWGKVSNS